MKMTNKVSKVWEHFEEIENEDKSKKTVLCKICSVALAFHGSTTSMREHLERKHTIYLLDDG